MFAREIRGWWVPVIGPSFPTDAWSAEVSMAAFISATHAVVNGSPCWQLRAAELATTTGRMSCLKQLR